MPKSKFKRFFKKFDYFGVVFNFKYKSSEKYRSATGGIGFLLFIGISLTYGIINALPLFKREKMSVIDYQMQMFKTDQLNFKNYSFNFAVGVSSCPSLKNLSEFWDLFSISVNHVKYIKVNGTRNKEKEKILLNYCDYKDFNNEMNNTFDVLGLNTIFCPEKTNYTINGIFSDSLFQYIEIILKAKDESPEKLEKIQNILISDECNLNVYYTDYAFDLFNFKVPSQGYLTTQFLTIKFREIMKMNIFFKLKEFNSYEDYFFEQKKSKNLMGFSNYEMYSNYKGTERFETKMSDYNVFAKVYIRAGLTREVIERRYEKITEFAAAVSSILSAILLFMFLVMTFINKFYANESVMHQIFQFNNFKKGKKKNIKNDFRKIINKNVYLFDEPEDKLRSRDLGNSEKSITNTNGRRMNTEDSLRVKKSNSIIPGMTEINRIVKKKKLFAEHFNISYNLIEIFFVMFCPSCSWTTLRKKNTLFEKGLEKLFFQLDILNYLKRMQLLDILSYCVLEPHENIIVQFLSKPSISLAQKKDIYDTINSVNSINLKEADELYLAIKKIYENSEKSPMEKRLFQLTKGEMGALIKKMKKK